MAALVASGHKTFGLSSEGLGGLEMLDYSRPLDKANPDVLRAWGADMRMGVVEQPGGAQCQADHDLLAAVGMANAALDGGDIRAARAHLERAAHLWSMTNR